MLRPERTKQKGKKMTVVEFKLYRDQRIRDLSSAYADSPDSQNADPNIRTAWEQLRQNWQGHAEAVKTYAYEENMDQLMATWRSVATGGRFRNEHEGIALNPNLSRQQVADILAVAEANPNMYWVAYHLKQHPNKG